MISVCVCCPVKALRLLHGRFLPSSSSSSFLCSGSRYYSLWVCLRPACWSSFFYRRSHGAVADGHFQVLRCAGICVRVSQQLSATSTDTVAKTVIHHRSSLSSCWLSPRAISISLSEARCVTTRREQQPSSASSRNAVRMAMACGSLCPPSLLACRFLHDVPHRRHY